MNAVDPTNAHPPSSSPDAAPDPALAYDAFQSLCRQAILVATAVVVLLLAGAAATLLPPRLARLADAFAASLLLPLMVSGLLLVLLGLTCTTVMAWARSLPVRLDAATPPARTPPRWRRLAHRLPASAARGSLISRAAGWPQSIVAGLIGLMTLWLLHGAPIEAGGPDSAGIFLGAAAIVMCFPLLVAERHYAAAPAAKLPEAPALHALFLLCVIVWAGAGLVQIAIGLGIGHAASGAIPIGVLVAAVAAELVVRAAGRCFLPPPAPAEARAAIHSLIASMIADGVQARSLAGPVRRQFGIDMSHSWALSYVRSALPHVLLILLLLVWGLSGIVLVGFDQRGIYERFGAPVAVLHPGLHVILPWPMGRVRRVAFGPILETALTEESSPARTVAVGAEDRAPPDADRLWEQPHPSELAFLIASPTPLQTSGAAQQSFQVVNADIRLLYRVGLTDHDALQAAYRAKDPVSLVRATAGRVLAEFFAGRTLDAVLGENRETMADRLRSAVQQELTRLGSGIDLVGVVIEAIHPPAGAAEAYHAVQAAEIMAAASIAAEQGRAIADLSRSRQYATDLVLQAQGAAAETSGAAHADLTRFGADKLAAGVGGEAFLVNRYLTDLSRALSREQVVIVDHRIPLGDAPLLDLRPPGSAPAPDPLPDRE